MPATSSPEPRLTPEAVEADFQRQPHLLLRLAENALNVAENLRDNYFRNTTRFLSDLRRRTQDPANPILGARTVPHTDWSALAGEVVTFLDGGIGRVPIASQLPILLRVGSYSVRTGERRLAQREQFGYYPVILGDLEGGSKERDNFPDLVRITAELLGGLAALERTSDLRVLMFHGPLITRISAYAGHTPFTERDVDLLLRHYAAGTRSAQRLKDDFLRWARLAYPAMTDNYDLWVRRRLFEPLAWLAFLCRRLIHVARRRNPVPLILGVVERSELRDFLQSVLLPRVFRGLRDRERSDYFNRMYGRTDLTNPARLLDRLGYSDALLLGMLLGPGQFSEPWRIAKYDGLHSVEVSLPDQPIRHSVNFAPLQGAAHGFPQVRGCYLMVGENSLPLRIEVFEDLASPDMVEEARRVHLYSRLLPGYGFPVGLQVADRYARVPDWLTSAYGKLIRHYLGVSLQENRISDPELRRILVQAIYVTQRDWLFRPRTC
jgi:hypothetical protein